MSVMNNKKQPPESFYDKAVLKTFLIPTGKYLRSNLFLSSCRSSVCNFIKKRFQHRCFSVNIAKFLKMVILKKICERLLLGDVKRNYSSMKTVKKLLYFSQQSQENTFTWVSFIINIVAACNWSRSLFKKRFRHWFFWLSEIFNNNFLKSIDVRNVD